MSASVLEIRRTSRGTPESLGRSRSSSASSSAPGVGRVAQKECEAHGQPATRRSATAQPRRVTGASTAPTTQLSSRPSTTLRRRATTPPALRPRARPPRDQALGRPPPVTSSKRAEPHPSPGSAGHTPAAAAATRARHVDHCGSHPSARWIRASRHSVAVADSRSKCAASHTQLPRLVLCF